VRLTLHNALGAPAPAGGYSQAAEISDAKRVVFVSGQIPVTQAGEVPATFAEQCRLVWRNVEQQLAAAGMSLDDVVKATTYLSDRRFAEENGVIRREILGERRPALTVVITEIFDPAWRLEIEAIAAK
jgi:enamine deaminase RidA (YjgF/YER057c/UK114 family)